MNEIPQKKKRPLLLWLAGLTIITVMGCCTLLLFDASQQEPTQVIVPTELPARLAPTIPIVPPDTPIPPATASPTIQPTAQPPTVTASENVNLRSGPGTEYGIAGTLAAGQVLPVVGRVEDSTWLQVTTGNGPAWVAASVVIVSGPVEQAPIVTPPEVPATLAPIIEPTPTPAGPTCDCSGDLYNCDDFSDAYDAQRCLEACPGDPHDLDRDGDGNACEWEP